MEVDFLDKAIDDIEFWKKSGNKTVQSRITKLLESICITPYSGIGKPEPISMNLAGTGAAESLTNIAWSIQFPKIG